MLPLKIKVVRTTALADIFQSEPIKSSGLTHRKKVAALAKAFCKALTPYNTSRHLGVIVTLHLIAASPTARGPHACTILPEETMPNR